jgi:hypothetical protein
MWGQLSERASALSIDGDGINRWGSDWQDKMNGRTSTVAVSGAGGGLSVRTNAPNLAGYGNGHGRSAGTTGQTRRTSAVTGSGARGGGDWANEPAEPLR